MGVVVVVLLLCVVVVVVGVVFLCVSPVGVFSLR